MKHGFYPKMALSNMRKNARFFIPRILTGTGLLGCFYIMITLMNDTRLSEIKGGDYIPDIMVIGSAVIGLLSFILMLYTNSFLMKQRKREFGLYNVLGMEKRHVGKVLFFESFFTTAAIVISGCAFGILFYKLCSLLICKLLKSEIILGFYYITPVNILISSGVFVLFDILTYFINRINIRRMKPVELLSSRSTGEKEPKTKFVLLIFGIISLAAGYYLALSTENPIQAIYLFFLAVLLVIFGTYALFITGSIAVLKLLKKNEKYYYNAKHMPAISGLLYRMKQNAVGLASIAILATGVLIMISTTVSLYSGQAETLKSNYPQHAYFEASVYDNNNKFKSIPLDVIEKFAYTAAEKNEINISRIDKQKFLESSFVIYGNKFLVENATESEGALQTLGDIASVNIITQSEYEELTGKKLNLKSDEITLCPISLSARASKALPKTITINNRTFYIKQILTYHPITSRTLNAVSSYGMVVSDEEALDFIYNYQKEGYGEYASSFTTQIAITFENLDKACEVGESFSEDLVSQTRAYNESNSNSTLSIHLDTYWGSSESLMGMYGSLLFLGLLLGFVCMFATVLIIYYKQISEGYEDRQRFQIMKKIGMSNNEVKKTIKNQVLIQFFLPLIVAAVHVSVAFPILVKLLHLLLLSSTWLFFWCLVITFALFTVTYIIIYSLTAKTYYKIVH